MSARLSFSSGGHEIGEALLQRLIMFVCGMLGETIRVERLGQPTGHIEGTILCLDVRLLSCGLEECRLASVALDVLGGLVLLFHGACH